MRASRSIAVVLVIAAAGCQQTSTLERRLESFEVTITSPVGSPEHRCLLPGSSTAGVDLSGCPTYEHDAGGNTIARVNFVARAIDNFGALYETFDSVAVVKVVPGKIEPAFRQVRFAGGVAEGLAGSQPSAAFRAAFGDTFLWITDENSPPRSNDTPGLGTPCDYRDPTPCDTFPNLGCANTTPVIGFDPQGLAYCTLPCSADPDCPSGYHCEQGIQSYPSAIDVGSSACVRAQPSYATGTAGPIHLVEPSLADTNRADSLIASPFQEDFVDVRRGNMVVTAVRIDGFYVSDTCPIRGYRSDAIDEFCSPEERADTPEFNHLFVFNFSRPDDLFPGDRLISVSGPINEFNGLTELNFPLWEVDFDHSPQPVPDPVDLNGRLIELYPNLLQTGERCVNITANPQNTAIVQCDFAMERLEAARVSVKVKNAVGVLPGSREEQNFNRFGQWPIVIDDGTPMGRTFQMITRENIPFFDPIAFGAHDVNQTVTGNLRQVAFDDRSEPIWIVEPRDQADCPWCMN